MSASYKRTRHNTIVSAKTHTADKVHNTTRNTSDNNWTCSCKAYKFRNTCKHINNAKARETFERNNATITTTLWTKMAIPNYDTNKLQILEDKIAGTKPSWTVQLRRRGSSPPYYVYYTPTGYRLRSESEVTKYLM